jgi:rod shape-determining protein MreC
MFSKKMVIIVGAIALIAVNIVLLSAASRRYSSFGLGPVAISFIAPFQELVIGSVRIARNIWDNYFYLVAAAHENQQLKKQLNQAIKENSQRYELELANNRLRNLLNLRESIPNSVIAAEVIGKGPSAWFRTVIIDKGKVDGLHKGLPVVTPQGIAGQIVDVSDHYAKVMLIIDHNSAVDALIQRSRARGIIKGTSSNTCRFDYVMKKHDIRAGDTVVASGFDSVYPKGLRIGRVTEIVKQEAKLFNAITVSPFVDFEKLEEVLVVLKPPIYSFAGEK